MSIFVSILSKIFPSNHPAVAANAAPAAGAQPAGAAATPDAGAAGAPAQTGAAAPAPASAAAPAPEPVDVEQVLTDKAEQNGQQLNWRSSIVDLMKLLDLDSSLAARKQLAQELHYSGDVNDSATMNIWLHKQVMTQLAANGGKVPDDLKH